MYFQPRVSDGTPLQQAVSHLTPIVFHRWTACGFDPCVVLYHVAFSVSALCRRRRLLCHLRLPDYFADIRNVQDDASLRRILSRRALRISAIPSVMIFCMVVDLRAGSRRVRQFAKEVRYAAAMVITISS